MSTIRKPGKLVHNSRHILFRDKSSDQNVSSLGQFTNDELEPQLKDLVHSDEMLLIRRDCLVIALNIEQIIKIQVLSVVFPRAWTSRDIRQKPEKKTERPRCDR